MMSVLGQAAQGRTGSITLALVLLGDDLDLLDGGEPGTAVELLANAITPANREYAADEAADRSFVENRTYHHMQATVNSPPGRPLRVSQ